MNGNQKWPSYCETYEMNFHRRWKGDNGIYFGYRFWFHYLYEQNDLFFGSFFSRQRRFWNMISMIFVVLYDKLHYCNLPYERSETESSRFENNVTSSHTSECRLAVRSATRRVDLRRVAYPCLKARKTRWLRNTEIRAMQRKQGWKLGGSGFRKKIINSSDNYLCIIITLSPKQEK